MNTSINERLGRTILTGGATLIPLICLFLFGGSVLRDFRFGDPDRSAGRHLFVHLHRLAGRALVEQGAWRKHPYSSPRK
jgi:hypothetical protein